MDGDVIFLIGMVLFYLFRRFLKQGKKRQAPTAASPVPIKRTTAEPKSEQIPKRNPEPVALHYQVDTGSDDEDFLAEKTTLQPRPVEPVLVKFLRQILDDPQGQLPAQEQASSAWQSEESLESAAPVGASDDRFNEMASNEWHTETRDDWTDQTADFDFHATIKSQRTPHDDHRDRSFVDRKSKTPSRTKNKPEKIPASSAPVHESLRIRARLSNRTELKEAFILQLVLGPPVSLRNRPARHHLS